MNSAANAIPAETPTTLSGNPTSSAAGKKPTTSAIEIQFGIFIVVRSCSAATTASTGRTARRTKES